LVQRVDPVRLDGADSNDTTASVALGSGRSLDAPRSSAATPTRFYGNGLTYIDPSSVNVRQAKAWTGGPTAQRQAH
jgi:hypothetical protein